MVEKWMQSKPNSYAVKRVVRHSINPYASKKIVRHPFPKKSAYYGMPTQLFRDSDKDKIANVFDCRPHNKKKTDVISPANWGSGYTDMYQRQENARLVKLYAKQQQEAYEKQLLELQRIAGETTTIITPGTTTEHYTSYAVDPETGEVVTGPAATKALQKQVDIVTGKTPTTTTTTPKITYVSSGGKTLIPTVKAPTSNLWTETKKIIVPTAKVAYTVAKVSPAKSAINWIVKTIKGSKK